MEPQRAFAACDVLTKAIKTVIALGDEEIAQELVPELDRIRTHLNARTHRTQSPVDLSRAG